MVQAQEWLEKNYFQKPRRQIKEINASNQNLEGDLDLTDFPCLRIIDLRDNPQLGKIVDEKISKTIIRLKAQH